MTFMIESSEDTVRVSASRVLALFLAFIAGRRKREDTALPMNSIFVARLNETKRSA